jgi:hypothetical protein
MVGRVANNVTSVISTVVGVLSLVQGRARKKLHGATWDRRDHVRVRDRRIYSWSGQHWTNRLEFSGHTTGAEAEPLLDA